MIKITSIGPNRLTWSDSEREAVRQAYHDAARAAIRKSGATGMLPKVCEGCGAKKALEAHHYMGYSLLHWLDVRWLCRSCHQIAELSAQPCDCVACALAG